MNVRIKRVYVVTKNRTTDAFVAYQTDTQFCYLDPESGKIIVRAKDELIFGDVDFKALHAENRPAYYFAERDLADEYSVLCRRNWKVWKYQDQIDCWKKGIAAFKDRLSAYKNQAAELEEQIVAEKEALING